MSKYTDQKSEQLGENISTANAKLRKQIMFYMANKLEMLNCFHCGNKIENIEEFSIEHKDPWFSSESPVENFYDINNIAFSHISCNCSKRRCKLSTSNKHGFKGVARRIRQIAKPFDASICKNEKNTYLGSFATPQEAAMAYDKAALEVWGDRAVTNKSLGLLE